MKDPNESQKCQIDPSYCKFGSETLLKLLTSFDDQIDGAKRDNEDIEYVHKTRVTSRRLRAALLVFRICFPPKKFKKWSSQIKKVTQILGDARDLDVQIAFIEQYIKRLSSTVEKAGVNILLKEHKARRESIQPFVANGLEKLQDSNILKDIRKFCEKTSNEQSTFIFEPNRVLEKARWNISFRLDDFISMEKYVFLENEKLKQHEMRIFAKKLRYTMEAFATAYENKLAKEIETIKSFQDVLGEMHDCDVWIEYIPKFIDKIKVRIEAKKRIEMTKIEKALLSLFNYVKERRKDQYNQLVLLWNENKKSGFFNQFRKTISNCLIMTEEKTKQILANPDVKIAVLSDIHANLQALEMVIQDAEERGADIFLNAGDSIGFGPYPNEVVELICEKNMLSILGNFDLDFIEGKTKAKGEKRVALKFARKELAKSCEYYLFSLPRELRFEVAGKRLFVTHGSPKSIEDHIYPNIPVERLKTLADAAKADIIIVGHSHEQFWKQINGKSFINPGSVGRPGDGKPQTAYAILSFNPFKVELIRLDYDVEAAANALRKKALPESFAQMLLRGVSLDTIIEEDETKENVTVQDCITLTKETQSISEKYWPDNEHFLQVSRLALNFFDKLINVHKLGKRERCWLECAAILHDVGLSTSRSSHHKKSAKIILNDTQLPIASKERRIVASIARYHRKGLPKQNHFNLAGLDSKTIQKVKILSSFLRVADGLDYSHGSNVKTLNVKVKTKRMTVEYRSQVKSTLEEQAFNTKKDLFEKVFSTELVLVWKQL